MTMPPSVPGRLTRHLARRTDRRAGLVLLAAGVIALDQAMATWVRLDGSPFLTWLIDPLLSARIS